jgi:hypothetical protein
MLAVMPADGTPWPRADRERWTAALAAVLDVVYEEDGRPREAEGADPVVDLRVSDDGGATPAGAEGGRGRHARRGPG